MKLGLYVQEFSINKVEINIKKLSEAIIKAKELDIDLVCFGESVLQGFFSIKGNWESDKDIALTSESETIQKIKEIAIKNNIAIAFGYIEREKNNIFSSYMIINRNGEVICNYHRISPGWKEVGFGPEYKEGKTFGSVTICNKTFVVGLCGDFWFDENILNNNSIKSEFVLWPVFIDTSYKEWKSTGAIEYGEQSKKIGKHVFLINSILNEKYHAEGGAIYFYNGIIRGHVDFGEVGLLVCEL